MPHVSGQTVPGTRAVAYSSGHSEQDDKNERYYNRHERGRRNTDRRPMVMPLPRKRTNYQEQRCG